MKIDKEKRIEAYGKYVRSMFKVVGPGVLQGSGPETLEGFLGNQIFDLGCFYKFATAEILEDAGITHICDLVVKTKPDLLKIKGIGKATVEEIERKLACPMYQELYPGLSLGMNISGLNISRKHNY